MDALFDVLGANGPEHAERRVKITRYLMTIRQTLDSVKFHTDVDLPPVLLAYALMECRMATCQIRGLVLLLARIYARNLEVRDLDVPPPPGQPEPSERRGPSGVIPFRPIAESIQPFVVGKDRDHVINALTAASIDVVGRWMADEEPFGALDEGVEPDWEADSVALREEFQRVFRLVLGDRGIH